MRRGALLFTKMLAFGLFGLLFLSASIVHANLPLQGQVGSGTLYLRCLATSCGVTLPVMGRFDIGGRVARVVSGHPGGGFLLRVQTEGGSWEARYAVCGRDTTLDLMEDRVVLMSDPCPAIGILQLLEQFPGERLFVDGRPVDIGPGGTLQFYAGERGLRFERDGFEPFLTTVVLVDGDIVAVRPEYVSLPGRVTVFIETHDVSVEVDASPWITDGRDVADGGNVIELDAGFMTLRLPSGRRTLYVAKPAHMPVAITLDVAPGSVESIPLTLAPLPGVLTVVAVPEHAQASIDGAEFEIGAPVALAPGPHRLVVSAWGYEDGEVVLEIRSSESAQVTVELRPLAVEVHFEGLPPDATVMLESGEVVSLEDGHVALAPGFWRVGVAASGYVPTNVEFVIEPGVPASIEVQLRRSATLELRASPFGATVAVDGVVQSERRFELQPGRHGVSVSAPGHEPYIDAVDIAEGELRTLEIVLMALPGRIAVGELPAGTLVTVDGEPWIIEDGWLGPVNQGRYVIAFQGPTHLPVTRSVRVGPGEDIELLDLPFVLLPATIELIGVPTGTRVKVGEGEVFVYGQPFDLPSGRHHLWIAADGMGRAQLTIDVEPGEKRVIPVRFP